MNVIIGLSCRNLLNAFVILVRNRDFYFIVFPIKIVTYIGV